MIDPHRFMLLCVGAQKAGTSSIFSSLSRHPQVLGLPEKEVHFFDRQGWSDSRSYVERFLNAGTLRQKTSRRPTWSFDASPSYLFHPLVAQRISDIFPRARILVTLRDPVKRAYSHYSHNVRAGREQRSFREAIREEMDSINNSPEVQAWDHPNRFIFHYSYLRRGLYVEQLERYQRYFPEDSMKVIFAEDFFHQPEVTLREMADFIGIRPRFRGSPDYWNRGKYDPSERDSNEKEIRDFFRKPNLALVQLLGRRLPWN